MDGIEIPREVADAEGVPEDLDANRGSPYRFPNPRRRRAAGVVFLAGGALAALGASLGLPTHLFVLAAFLVLVGSYHFAASWDLTVGEEEALAAAGRRVPFPVGHASAAVAFEGWRSRPVWHVLLYAADEPPSQRALVRVSGLDGSVLGDPFIEAVPPTG